jgi:cobalamin synthase
MRDAALAVVPRDRRLEILREPHVGAHAITALGIVLLLRFSALTVTPWVAPIVGAACGRWTMAITVATFRPARAEGLGAAYAKEAKIMPVAVVGLSIVTALVVPGGPRVAIAAACALAGGLGLAAWLARRFGGLTGDGHGAAGLAAETIALLALVPLW